MNSALLPVPVALVTVRKRSITKVNTVKKQPIRIGTIIPPWYIFEKVPIASSRSGQKPPFSFPTLKLSGLPITKRQMIYPIIIQASGAIQEIALLALFGCTDEVE